MRAIALCALLAATAAHAPTADCARAARFACVPASAQASARTALQTPNTIALKIDNGMMHTLLRRNNAHSQILHTCDCSTRLQLGYMIDGRMQHAETIQTILYPAETIQTIL